MKVKVISDGTSHGTSVIDKETGEALEGIMNIDIFIDPYSVVAKITLVGVELDLDIEDGEVIDGAI